MKLKAILTAAITFFVLMEAYPQVKYDDRYEFDNCNEFKLEAYARGNELMRTMIYKTSFQTTGENFIVRYITDKKGMGFETVIDKKNEVAIQIMGTGGGAVPMYNAGGYKYPGPEDLKKLEITATGETKKILGFTCTRYKYTYKKIFGEVWLTTEVTMPNDIGVFRACKMAALHNTLSVEGFVMEMTTEDEKGGRTLMTTTALKTGEKYSVDLAKAEVSKAVNKINYFTF